MVFNARAGVDAPDKVLRGDTALASRKNERMAEVDKKTQELIANGFMWNSVCCSLSTRAQIRIMGIRIAKDDITYPLVWSGKNDQDSMELANASEVNSFFLTALGTVKATVDSGTALKNSIRACSNIDAVNLIVDGR